jgi:hypothetical protein
VVLRRFPLYFHFKKEETDSVTQCCGTGTGTFCLSETGTVMYSGPGSEFGSESNTKLNTKVKKFKQIKKEMTTFWETMQL